MTNETQVAIAEQKELSLSDMFAGMMDLAKDPEVDPAKMSAILDMQERMIDRQALTAFRKAMHAARQKMPRIQKDGSITNRQGQVQSRYAHYEAIDKIVRPLIEAEGLTYGFDSAEGEGGRMLITCIVSHVDGHEERFGPMPLAIDTSGSKNATQGAGSASSYGKRYTLCDAFNIITVGQDDDGQSTSRQAPTESERWEALKIRAESEAQAGAESYMAFFQKLTNMEKGYLVDQGIHADNKQKLGL